MTRPTHPSSQEWLTTLDAIDRVFAAAFDGESLPDDTRVTLWNQHFLQRLTRSELVAFMTRAVAVRDDDPRDCIRYFWGCCWTAREERNVSHPARRRHGHA